jgi:drug/metabolite transporter (DMT)-like permease
MLFAGLCWTTMAILVRQLSGDYTAFELLFFRNLVAVLILLPTMMRAGVATFRTNRFPLHCLRAFFSCLAVLGLYYGIGQAPLPDVTALSFAQPLFGVVLAALVLKEFVDFARWRAVFFGFVGILVILRPGFADFNIAILTVLGSALCYACGNICVKRLMTTDTPNQAVIYFNVLILPLALLPTLYFWVTPTPGDLVLMIGIGLCGTAAVYGYAASFNAADVSAVMPFDFMRLPMAAIGAFLLFGELGDFWIWVGSAIIFASAWVLARSEGKRG